MIRRIAPDGLRVEAVLSRQLPDDAPRVLLPKQYAKSEFRAVRVRETVRASSDEDAVIYEVEVSGPVVTKTGKDHADQRGSLTYVSTSEKRPWSGPHTDDVPDALKPYLRGQEVVAETAAAALTRDGAR